MKDSILEVTNSIKTSLSSLKRKTASLKSSLVSIETDLDKLDLKLDKFYQEADAYKARISKAAAKEVRELQQQIEELEETLESVSHFAPPQEEEVDSLALSRASTVAILESILTQISIKADDFKLISYAFLFPALYEDLPIECSPDFLLDTIPPSAQTIVNKGLSFLQALRDVCEEPLTNRESWDSLSVEVAEWWKGQGLPLLFGRSRESWDCAKPYTLDEMTKWKSNVADRMIDFPGVFDSFENYREHKDTIYSSSGVKDFELRQFSLANNLTQYL